jgi:hypothetical protein
MPNALAVVRVEGISQERGRSAISITITDANLIRLLHKTGDLVELCDAQGKVLGEFHPHLRNAVSPEILARFPPMTATELAEGLASGPGLMLAEIHKSITAKLKCAP